MPEQGATEGRLQIVTDLREAALAPERREAEVVCIRPGLSKNGNYYSRAVVQAMAPLFEGARAFADHPGPGERPERSIRDIVGYYRDPHVDESGALQATLHVTRNADWLWALIEEAIGTGQATGQPGLIGISIDADARVAPGRMEGRQVRVVEAITRLHSCDVVTRASAAVSNACCRPTAQVGGTSTCRRTRKPPRWRGTPPRRGRRSRCSKRRSRPAPCRRCRWGRSPPSACRAAKCRRGPRWSSRAVQAGLVVLY